MCRLVLLSLELDLRRRIMNKVIKSLGARRLASVMGAAVLVVSCTTVVASASTMKAHTAANVRACVVTDTGGLNDKSFNASAYAGLLQGAAANKNVTPLVVSTPTNGAESDYDQEISSFVAQKCNIIIGVGYLMADAIWNAAVKNPTVHFAIVDSGNTSPGNDGIAVAPTTGTTATNNILGLTYNTQEDAFLGGYEAAAYAVSVNPAAPKVATYGGQQFGSVTAYMDGYYEGAMYYNTTVKPKHAVKVLGWDLKTQKGTFIGSFNDQATARTDTTAFLAAGATTVFPVAGNDGLGTTAAVRTWNAAASHKIKANAEWVDTDGCISDATDCSLFLNSVTKGVAASVNAAVTAEATGTFAGGLYVGTLKNGGAAFAQDLSSPMAKKLSASVLTAVAGIAAKIKNGTIKVTVGG